MKTEAQLSSTGALPPDLHVQRLRTLIYRLMNESGILAWILPTRTFEKNNARIKSASKSLLMSDKGDGGIAR